MYGHIILKLYVQSFRKMKHGSVCERVYMSVADTFMPYLTIRIFRFHKLERISLTGDLVLAYQEEY
jgi:hypothetical protein